MVSCQLNHDFINTNIPRQILLGNLDGVVRNGDCG